MRLDVHVCISALVVPFYPRCMQMLQVCLMQAISIASCRDRNGKDCISI